MDLFYILIALLMTLGLTYAIFGSRVFKYMSFFSLTFVLAFSLQAVFGLRDFTAVVLALLSVVGAIMGFFFWRARYPDFFIETYTETYLETLKEKNRKQKTVEKEITEVKMVEREDPPLPYWMEQTNIPEFGVGMDSMPTWNTKPIFDHWDELSEPLWSVYQSHEHGKDMLAMFVNNPRPDNWELGEPWSQEVLRLMEDTSIPFPRHDYLSPHRRAFQIALNGYFQRKALEPYLDRLHYFARHDEYCFEYQQRWIQLLASEPLTPVVEEFIVELLKCSSIGEVRFGISVVCELEKHGLSLLPHVWQAIEANREDLRYADGADGNLVLMKVDWSAFLQKLGESFGEAILSDMEEFYDTSSPFILNQQALLFLFSQHNYKPERFVPVLTAMLEERVDRPPCRVEDYFGDYSGYQVVSQFVEYDNYASYLWHQWETSYRKQHEELTVEDYVEHLQIMQAKPPGILAAQALLQYKDSVQPYAGDILKAMSRRNQNIREFVALRKYLSEEQEV